MSLEYYVVIYIDLKCELFLTHTFMICRNTVYVEEHTE